MRSQIWETKKNDYYIQMKYKIFCINNILTTREITSKSTSVISFKAVSQPKENSVPGTLLLMVAGIIAIGILNSSNLSLAL